MLTLLLFQTSSPVTSTPRKASTPYQLWREEHLKQELAQSLERRGSPPPAARKHPPQSLETGDARKHPPTRAGGRATKPYLVALPSGPSSFVHRLPHSGGGGSFWGPIPSHTPRAKREIDTGHTQTEGRVVRGRSTRSKQTHIQDGRSIKDSMSFGTLATTPGSRLAVTTDKYTHAT